MDKQELIDIITKYKENHLKDLDSGKFADPSFCDYAEGTIDTCDFILSKLQ
jgi:hypothetical protein